MPYKNTDGLPENIKNLPPKHAQKIFVKAYNNSLKQYTPKNDAAMTTLRRSLIK